ncbi:hypothetical protein TrispH2_007138 [Trichoplax sp. H2]|nr:hypothetical protein TrispH2_007138 [Trichoplax sp. H2]|eukprot:RDD40185.1 hypothetical protein TrispH2_007138 [Trichoplax sp. H2]
MASELKGSTSSIELPMREEEKVKFPINRRGQDIISHERESETLESQDLSWQDNLSQGISNLNHNDIPQGFTKKMVLVTVNETGIIHFNMDNVNQISVATAGITRCAAVVIGYRKTIIGKDGQSHPVVSLLLAHVDLFSHSSFIADRLEEIKRKNPNFKEQDITIDVITNPNYYRGTLDPRSAKQYLRDNCSHIKNSKGDPCYNVRHNKNGTALCQGMIKNDKIEYELVLPMQVEIERQAHYCMGNLSVTSNLLKDYFIDSGHNIEFRSSIHRLYPYLIQLEYRSFNKTDPFPERKLDIIYNNDIWADSSAILSIWCKKQLKQLKKYRYDDEKLKEQIRKLYQKCYQGSFYSMPAIEVEKNVYECIAAMKDYWLSVEKYQPTDGN